MSAQNLINKTGDVFISYRHNHIDLVNPVIEELERRKISYFIDREGIHGGMEYSELIPKAIEACKVFLFFWTSDANQSDDMLREVKIALDYHKKIIPYKIGHFDIHNHSSLYYFFSTICYLEQANYTTVDLVNQIVKALQDIQQHTEIKKIFQDAEKGNSDAQTDLGWRYIRGDGVERDETEAIKWLSKAAEQGHPSAQVLLSLCYSNGKGISKDPAKAQEWWYKSLDPTLATTIAAGGAAIAAGAAVTTTISTVGLLGILPLVGAGYFLRKVFGGVSGTENDNEHKIEDNEHKIKQDKVPQDFTQAFKAYQKAAQQGNSRAQNVLGFCYAYGVGVIKDVVEAKKWFQKAAQQGDEDAKKALKALK